MLTGTFGNCGNIISDLLGCASTTVSEMVACSAATLGDMVAGGHFAAPPR